MLDMGFIDDMKFILAQIPKNCQRMMFSATIPTEISWLAKRYMKDPAEVKISEDTPTVPQTSHKFYVVTEFDKFNVLCKLIDSELDGLLLVFRKTKTGVDDLATALNRRGYKVRGLHGDYSQREREKVMRLFRKGQVDILIATDVAARGLDVSGITHVVNYDIPQDPESYIHRIGRTGRAGKEGMAITFITHWQYTELKRIQTFSKVKIERANTPIVADYDRVARA
jgi:ATP-dependent RNA helicase DeaD